VEIITLNIEYFFENGNWIARCDEVGLVGYQHKDLTEVRDLVKEGMLLHTDGGPFELIETIEPSGNRTAV
jgi:predicted RNase H-like HicB family nuclease